MAEEGHSAASSSSSAMSMEKPVIVRVKRKASQMPLDALWLEINERPPKRTILDMANLSFTGTFGQNKGNSKTKMVLVQHVQTVQCSEATRDLLELCLEKSTDSGSRNKIEERKFSFKKDKRPELLHSNARQKHAELAKSARFEQIWRSRMSEEEKDDDFISKIYRLYNVVRVDDDDEERHENDKAQKGGADDENSILCNYMPLIREYLPTAAEEIESDMNTNASNGDAYMYDIYTMEGILDSEAQVTSDYPLVHVDDQDLYDDDSESGWETDDSNAENNPQNDYPDEESSEDGDVLLSEEEEYEEDISGASEEDDKDDHDWRWGYR